MHLMQGRVRPGGLSLPQDGRLIRSAGVLTRPSLPFACLDPTISQVPEVVVSQCLLGRPDQGRPEGSPQWIPGGLIRSDPQGIQ